MNFRNSGEIQSLTQIVGAAPSIYERRDQVRYDDFLRVVTRVLKKTVDKMLLDIKSRHQPSTTNNRFVHYTSISTLVSLLEKSGQGSNDYLRLYDSAHFNDPDEGRYLERYSGRLLGLYWNNFKLSQARLYHFLCSKKSSLGRG